MRRSLLQIPHPAILAALKAASTSRVSHVERAMAQCRAAWTDAHNTAKENGYPASKALRMAQVAYKLAMPSLDQLSGIRAAIACIAQGIQLEVFDGRDGSQLLYAAQVAITVQKKKGPKKP